MVDGWGQTEKNPLLCHLPHDRDVFSLTDHVLLCRAPGGAVLSQQGCSLEQPWDYPGLHQHQDAPQLPKLVIFLSRHL